MKNYWSFLFIIFLITSCNFVQKEIPNSQELLRRELHAIDWDKVDTYPTYDSCDKFTNAAQNKTCFFDRFSFELTRLLTTDSIVKLSTIDTVEFLVTISKDQKLNFKTEYINEKLLPKSMLDSIMLKNTSMFSKINAATKRGVPVTTQFQLGLKIPSSSD